MSVQSFQRLTTENLEVLATEHPCVFCVMEKQTTTQCEHQKSNMDIAVWLSNTSLEEVSPEVDEVLDVVWQDETEAPARVKTSYVQRVLLAGYYDY